MNLFYIGYEFYAKSNTAMSFIYEVGTFIRMDWGFVQIALAEGKEVHIRQANSEEKSWAYEQLGRIVSK